MFDLQNLKMGVTRWVLLGELIHQQAFALEQSSSDTHTPSPVTNQQSTSSPVHRECVLVVAAGSQEISSWQFHRSNSSTCSRSRQRRDQSSRTAKYASIRDAISVSDFRFVPETIGRRKEASKDAFRTAYESTNSVTLSRTATENSRGRTVLAHSCSYRCSSEKVTPL